MPPDAQSNSLALAAVSKVMPSGIGSLAGDFLGMKNQGSVYISILHSRTLQNNLVNRFDLRKVYFVRLMVSARKELEKNTTVDEDKKSGVITIRVTDRSATRARDLANAYVEELNRISAELNVTAAHRERVFIEGRLQQVKEDLDRTSKEFSEFSSKNLAIDLKEQGKAMVGAAATLQGELIAAQTELQGLEQIYTDNNVRVRVLRTRVSELKRQLEKMAGTVDGKPAIGSVENGQLATAKKEGKKEKETYPSIRELPVLGIQYADLYRREKIQETIFELLTQQFELAKIQEAKEFPTVRILDSPEVPENKSSPRRSLMFVAALFFSLALGSTWVIGKEYWNGVDSDSNVKAFLNPIGESIHSFWHSRGKLGVIWLATTKGITRIFTGTRDASR
jgi:capsule polysaccharide export protein KpsE/RkpR